MIEKLVNYLEECSKAYYNTQDPLVSNDTYDAMVETLKKLDPNNPYLEKIGAPAELTKSNKRGRLIPMGTLSKYHDEEEVRSWLEKESDDLILLAPKYDGFAVELVYQKGNLVMASTRGDGHVGEDVLESILRISSIPVSLPAQFYNLERVRGEVIIPRVNHDKMRELGYSAMRNAVPGIVRGNNKEALLYVDFVAYEFFDGSTDRAEQRARYSGVFNVESISLFHKYKSNFEDILMKRDHYGSIKESWDYEIDGVVLKSNTIKEDDLLHPEHQIAWKFKSKYRDTVLRDVKYQMGLSGRFVPIAEFDSVEFQGASLVRASLGNITRMKSEFKGVTVGSIIEVSRRGDIIPYVESLTLINDEGAPIEIPSVCPHCGQHLVLDGEEPCCTNKQCPELLRMQISFYARSVGVKGIGDKLIRGLIDAGYIRSIKDIYTIDPAVISNLPRQGSSSIAKWVELQNKELSILEILSCYPFLDLGAKVWKLVLGHLVVEDIVSGNLTADVLFSANIKGLGEKKILNIVSQVATNLEELKFILRKFNHIP